MADLLGKIKGKIDKGISTVNVKSKEIIEKQKIKLQLSELEAEKKNLLLELGKLAYLMINDPEETEGIETEKINKSKKSKDIKPDKWEQAVLTILSSICEGKLDKLLFENTDKEFKITAKSLSAEVQKSLPKSEQKGQNLQWLGRVLGKFSITSRKYSKRINRERQTVYEFDKQTTLTALKKVVGTKTKPAMEGKLKNYRELLTSKSNQINIVENKIKQLEEKLSKAKN
ncbi:MAG: hypothetical protein WBA70_11955 [Thermodesulfobacteriota bacterium]